MKALTSIDETSIDKFIKFLEKDKRGRVNYTQFTNRMNDISNRDHNPFQ
jgi:Ca2+-binding EF-hand superfamily protein